MTVEPRCQHLTPGQNLSQSIVLARDEPCYVPLFSSDVAMCNGEAERSCTARGRPELAASFTRKSAGSLLASFRVVDPPHTVTVAVCNTTRKQGSWWVVARLYRRHLPCLVILSLKSIVDSVGAASADLALRATMTHTPMCRHRGASSVAPLLSAYFRLRALSFVYYNKKCLCIAEA